MSKAYIQIEIGETDFVERLEKLEANLRRKALRAAVNDAVRIAAGEIRRRAPKPGYKGDKPGKTPLKKSITHATRSLDHAVVGFAGARWPDGAHVHLVEFGHEMVISRGKRKGRRVGRVRANPFIRPAARAVRRKMEKAMVARIDRAIAESMR